MAVVAEGEAFKAVYLRDAQFVFSRVQHHVHKIMSREIVREHGVMLLLGSMRAEERLPLPPGGLVHCGHRVRLLQVEDEKPVLKPLEKGGRGPIRAREALLRRQEAEEKLKGILQQIADEEQRKQAKATE